MHNSANPSPFSTTVRRGSTPRGAVPTVGLSRRPPAAAQIVLGPFNILARCLLIFPQSGFEAKFQRLLAIGKQLLPSLPICSVAEAGDISRQNSSKRSQDIRARYALKDSVIDGSTLTLDFVPRK